MSGHAPYKLLGKGHASCNCRYCRPTDGDGTAKVRRQMRRRLKDAVPTPEEALLEMYEEQAYVSDDDDDDDPWYAHYLDWLDEQ